MLKTISIFHHRADEALRAGVPLNRVLGMDVREAIIRSRYVDEDRLDYFDKLAKEIVDAFTALSG